MLQLIMMVFQVEGGSGDGVVGQENKRQSAPGRSSVSELYAEIPENVSSKCCKRIFKAGTSKKINAIVRKLEQFGFTVQLRVQMM